MEQQEKELSQQPFWNRALHAVRKDSTASLVEDFTSEMTLVAEGLYEDQNKLRSSVDELSARQDRSQERLDSRLQALENQLDAQQRSTDEQLGELKRRLQAMESRLPEPGKRGKLSALSGGFMHQLVWIVAIGAGAWVLVTFMQLFK